MNKKPLRITGIRDEGKDIKTFFFEEKITKTPGRFVQGWIPEYGEKPFTPSYENGFTVRRIKTDPSNPLTGRFTNNAFELKVGDYMWLTGPSGKGFPMESFNNRNVCIVGGGSGIPPLAFLSEKIRGSKVVSFLGSKTADEMIMEERFQRPFITTDDGSYGEKGFVTDVLKRYALGTLTNPRTKAAICGPEKMMYKAVEILEKYIPPKNIYVSTERLMKCGTGQCGSCELGGYRACIDGPVFTAEELKEVPDFGKFKRDRCGSKVPL